MKDLAYAAAIDRLIRRGEPTQELPTDAPTISSSLLGSVHRPAGKETHYGQTTEADPYDVDADWSERA